MSTPSHEKVGELLTPFAALACKALRRLFSSAVDRLPHAEANIDRGTHFLVGSGMADRGRLDDESIAVTVGETGSHRSVLISWNIFPALLLEPVAFEVEAPPPCLDWIVVLACAEACRTASPADAPTRFSAASPAGDDTVKLKGDAGEAVVLGVALHV
jgi:hypothetical protein